MLKFILTVVVRILASFLINSLFIHHYSQISFQFFFIYIAGNYVPSIAPRTPLSQPGNYVPPNTSFTTGELRAKQPGHMSQATRSHVTSNPVTCHKPTRSHVTSNPVTCHKQPGHMSQATRSHTRTTPLSIAVNRTTHCNPSHTNIHPSILSFQSACKLILSFFFILTTQQMREIHHNILFLSNRSSTDTRLIIRFKC